jgi:hypothetical protein
MPTKRARLTRGLSHRITAAAVEAYRYRDFIELHAALNLQPWQRSPLPVDVCGLGVDQGEPPEHEKPGPWRDSWYTARELQAELEAWPVK